MDIICSANDIGAVKSIPYNYCYKNNSFNTLKTFGINIEKLTVENFEKTKLLFSYIDKDNAYIKYTQELFRILPFESILNTVNYFLNPYNTKNCTIALSDKNKVEKFAKICLNLGYTNSIVFSSGDFPYVSIEDETYICEAWKNKIFSYTLNCELLEIEKGLISDLKVEDSNQNYEIIKAVFENKLKGSCYNAIVINSALALYIAKKAKSLAEGIALAKKTIDNGIANEILLNLKNLTFL